MFLNSLNCLIKVILPVTKVSSDTQKYNLHNQINLLSKVLNTCIPLQSHIVFLIYLKTDSLKRPKDEKFPEIHPGNNNRDNNCIHSFLHCNACELQCNAVIG